MQRSPLDGGIELERIKNENRIEIELASKFRFFFVALVFAILSFAVQFPTSTSSVWLKLVEATAWIGLAASGLLALVDVGAFRIIRHSTGYLAPFGRVLMWFFFLIAIAALLVAKIWASFNSLHG
jgi:hypothetical protein